MTTFLCVLFLLLGGVIVASEHNKQFALLVGRTFADMTYPIVRLVRLTTLPIHRWFDVSDMYSWECILQNPSFVPSKYNLIVAVMVMVLIREMMMLMVMVLIRMMEVKMVITKMWMILVAIMMMIIMLVMIVALVIQY